MTRFAHDARTTGVMASITAAAAAAAADEYGVLNAFVFSVHLIAPFVFCSLSFINVVVVVVDVCTDVFL